MTTEPIPLHHTPFSADTPTPAPNGASSFESCLSTANTIPLSQPKGKHDRPEFFPKVPKDAVGLSLSHQGLNDSSVIQLVHQGTLSQDNLQQHHALFLSYNQLGEAGLKALAKPLAHNTSIRHLILTGTGITSFAAAALADLLKVNHFIGWLVLNKNAIGKFGAQVLGDSLAENTGVKHVVLSDNEIDDDGIIALVDGLKHNDGILSLFLQGNPFGSEGVKALTTLINEHPTLKVLDIRDIGHLDSHVKTTIITMAERQACRLRL